MSTVSSTETAPMGADWVCLFDKGKCDEIRGLAPDDLPEFVQHHLQKLAWDSSFLCGFKEDASAPSRLSVLRERAVTEDDLKRDLVTSICVSEERVLLDYWGCYAEVFVKNPPGSIEESELFPAVQEPRYLLLTSDNVQEMLESLENHKEDIHVMSSENLRTLRRWRETCEGGVQYLIAYFFDS